MNAEKNSNRSQPKKVLIVLLGAIGDVTRALPLAVRLKKQWPEVSLSWAIEPKSLGVIEGHPAIDRVFVFDRPRGLSAYRRFLRELRRERFDLVLDLQRHLKSGLTSFFSGAPKRLGFHRRDAKEFNWLFNNQHIERARDVIPKIMHYQKFGDALGLAPLSPLDFGITISSDEKQHVEQVLTSECQTLATRCPPVEKRIALVIGSSWETRLWPCEQYQQLIAELFKRWGLVSILVGAKSEAARANVLLERAERGSVINVVEKIELRELKALFSVVRLAVGSDSGPMHIAAAVGTRVISLWGSTDPGRSAPYQNESRVLQSTVACSPCYLRKCPGLGTICMHSIPVQAVTALVQKEIEKGGGIG